MSLAVEPNFLSVRASGGKATHQLINGGPDQVLFRIKRSNDVDYHVTPLVGFIKGNSQLALEITRFPGAANQANLTIEYGPSKGVSDATLAWNYVTPTGVITLPLNAN